jgi:hypothetical protein
MSVTNYISWYEPPQPHNGSEFWQTASAEEAERMLQNLPSDVELTEVDITQETFVLCTEKNQRYYSSSRAKFSVPRTTVSTVREVLRAARPGWIHSSKRTQNAWDEIKARQWYRNAFASSEFASLHTPS